MNINEEKQGATPDGAMKETGTSFSPPPPPQPGAPRVRRNNPRNNAETESQEAVSSPILAIKDKSRSINSESVIVVPKKAKGKREVKNIYDKESHSKRR